MIDSTTSQKITPCLTFDGEAEDAMNFYTSLFDDSDVTNLTRYGADEEGAEGTVKQATFTPAISLSVNCETDAEIDELFAELSDDGNIFVPLDSYPFSEKFGWISGRFGVS